MYLEFRDVAGRLVHLPLDASGEPVTIGRNPGSSIYNKQSTVSRNHGRIGFDAGTLYIKDLGSSNGTFVNGERTTRSSLKVGDLVRCGEVFEIQIRDGAPDPAHMPERAGRDRGSRPTEMGRADPVDDGLDERRRRNAEIEAERERRRLEREQRRRGDAPEPAVAAPRPAEPRPAEPRPAEPRPAEPRREPERRSESVAERSEPKPAPARMAQSTGQSRVVPMMDLPMGGDAARELAELRRKVTALDTELSDAVRRATQFENDAKTAEQRAMRYSVELEGLSEKYRQLKEQNRVMSASLEDTREEQRKREDDAFEAERKVNELESELSGSRARAAEATEQLSGLKVRLTQKDRQIEELQRQLDLLEYELRTQRDEMDSLQSNFNREGGDVERLERKINLLQEVIQEKEAVVEQLRVDLRDKDIEIRQVRMGVGISDLEHEKRRLLEDYHNATRRVDELQGRLDQRSREMDSLRAELDVVRREATERKGPVDISDHPDMKARQREVERLTEQLELAQTDLSQAQQKLESSGNDAEALARVEAELAVAQKRTESLSGRLETAEARVLELQSIEPEPKGPALPPTLIEDMETLADAVGASRQNARLVRKYSSQLDQQLRNEGEAGEAASLLYDIAVVLAQDIGEQERLVREVQEHLTGGETR